jgi:hypothetical protein
VSTSFMRDSRFVGIERAVLLLEEIAVCAEMLGLFRIGPLSHQFEMNP